MRLGSSKSIWSQMPKRLLFVCIFNIQRSVAAEYIFRNMLAKKKPDEAKRIEVMSAGFIGQELNQWFQEKSIPLPDPLFDRPSTERVKAILLERGIDISRHRSRPADRAALQKSDIIIPFLPILKRDILTTYPEGAERIFLPKELLKEEIEFCWGETSAVPLNGRFFDFVHEESSYVRSVINEVDDFIQRAFPEIVTRLLGVSEAGGKAIV